MAPAIRYYGTTNGSVDDEERCTPPSSSDDEEQSLLVKQAPKQSWREHLTADVHRHRADMVLLLCYLITGLLDRNTVYIGLGFAAPNESKRWLKSGVSLASFCVGSFFFSCFHRFCSPRRRWVLCASFLLQMVLVLAAATILTVTPTSSDELAWTVLVPISLVAFQSCGQAVASRALQYDVLNSVVLTGIYADIFSDAELFAVRKVKRNRHVSAPVLLLFGAVMGGLLAHSVIGTAGVLWIAAALKLVVVFCWLLWPAADF
ncbi:hypothetical protein SPI_09086 [Niveomyces insectorum RCEF 264]|uniref:DUF1275 domain containing protein n=1 Tax=Niveomyces insectorum RCEF 264 TaxID=1081102 RepID=A0A167MB25_9HYPO|nr:hypothetical protein SPI_09086 [Niveomyces insectorum RCEF 264]